VLKTLPIASESQLALYLINLTERSFSILTLKNRTIPQPQSIDWITELPGTPV